MAQDGCPGTVRAILILRKFASDAWAEVYRVEILRRDPYRDSPPVVRFDCRIAAAPHTALPPAIFPQRGFLPPLSRGGTASPLPARGRIDLATHRRAVCARVVIACRTRAAS